MTRFVLTPRAEQDLNEIWSYIAQDSIEQADKVLDRFDKVLRQLARHPAMGRVREEWADRRHRFWPVYSYIILYRPDTKPLEVLRIVSGYRDLVEELKT
jgi:antitoxin ParD1/3/4/toxin ParE1/3/4